MGILRTVKLSRGFTEICVHPRPKFYEQLVRDRPTR